MKETRLVLTGGHAATTAIATIEEIKKRISLDRKKNFKIFWIGSSKALEGKNISTLEFKILPKLGVQTIAIFSGRIQRKFSFWTIPSILKIPIGFFHAFYILLKIKPKLILSFGGYSAFPVVVVGHTLGIPVIIHEQTMTSGLSNRLSQSFADVIAISWESSRKYFKNVRNVLTGNPVLSSIFLVPKKVKLGKTITLFITGGSRGSQVINKVVGESLENLLRKYNVIHQTGVLDFDKFFSIKEKLPGEISGKYSLYSTIDPSKMSEIYNKSDIVVSRAGANTLSEVLTIGIPTIFIPIPFSYLDEQNKNAEYAKNLGLARVINQNELSSTKLLNELNFVENNWQKMASSVKNLSRDENPSEKLVDLIFELLKISK